MGNAVRRVGQKCGCLREDRPENRTVLVGNHPPSDLDPVIPQRFCSNRIKSSKYKIITFVPKNLFEQFKRIANFYFLCVGAISLIIDSPVSPITSLLPLGFVIGVTAIKQGYEDWLRHKADKEVNNRAAYVVRDGQLTKIKSMDIKVGDIVRVQTNEGIPCDMVMLSSNESDGECYITTANLDGETNLKNFYCLHDTRDLQTEELLQSFRATIECQQPVTDLYRFIGRMNIHTEENEVVTRSLGPENVLLRGSRLKNTPFIYGCAIYTGQETKMALNSRYKSAKFSRIEKSMNSFLIVFLLMLLVASGLLTGLKHWFYSLEQTKQMWYPPKEKVATFLHVLEEFLSFMVLMNYVIPISLYVTIELQKFFGSMFFEWDLEMYDAQINERARANTSDLNEELGQVEYLLSDKTGTLTENDMQFRQCAIGDQRYIEHGGLLCKKPDIPGVQPDLTHTFTNEMDDFFTVLALCHTLRVDRKDHNGTGGYSYDGYEYEYQASSPDEKAFIEACRRYGVVYHGVRDDRAEITFHGKMKRFQVCHVLEFDPTRKRMSVIVADESGDVTLLCKGAESAILGRVTRGDAQAVERNVDYYALEGLRTLVIAIRKLSQEDYRRYNNALETAKRSLENREEMLQNVYDDLEKDLEVLGATAVEDRLQDGVPEALEALREAGIKVWVLTGDKQETAVNISHSAGHFTRDMIPLEFTRCHDEETASEKLKGLRKVVDDGGPLKSRTHALIVDGQSLVFALRDSRSEFLDVCTKCGTVLCCRMSPIQKAEVVRLVKSSKSDPTTAAIGDGANDVSMIQEAHIGIGIMGKEGRQAARSSDCAFGRFKFVQRALLVHGHYYYARTATLVLYFFYKNVAFITAQFYFTFYSGFSAQSIYDTIFLTLFNVTSTTLPILVYGIFEKYITMQKLTDRPSLYKRIARNSNLSWGNFTKWNMLGLWHSLVSFFGVYLVFVTGEPMTSDGKGMSVFDYGAIIYTVVVLTVNIKLMIETFHWNLPIFLGYGITVLGYFIIHITYNASIWYILGEYYVTLYWSFFYILSMPSVWFTIILLTFLSLLPDIILRVLDNTTSDVHRHVAAKVKTFYISRRNSGITTISDETNTRNHLTSNGVSAPWPGSGDIFGTNNENTGGIVNPAFDDNENTKLHQNISRVENPAYESDGASPDIGKNRHIVKSEVYRNDDDYKSSKRGIVNPAYELDETKFSSPAAEKYTSSRENSSLSGSRPSGLKLERDGTVATISSSSGEGMTNVENTNTNNLNPLHTTRSASSVELVASLSEITPL